MLQYLGRSSANVFGKGNCLRKRFEILRLGDKLIGWRDQIATDDPRDGQDEYKAETANQIFGRF